MNCHHRIVLHQQTNHTLPNKIINPQLHSQIKTYCANTMTDLTYKIAYHTHNDNIHLLPSILLLQTSYPLISMCESSPTNRLPNCSFIIALKRKLCLPIFDPITTPNHSCGVKHIIWGEHIFQCIKHNKIGPHNFISDNWASALQLA